jgi:hypothetical protein
MLSNFLQVLFGSYVANSVTDLSAVFSFACFFLFIAAVPLYLASETLPERDKQLADLRNYYKTAKKKADKKLKKSKKANRSNNNSGSNDSSSVSDVDAVVV